MATTKSNFSKNLLMAASLLFFCILTACESKKSELPLIVPQVEDSTQYVDLYCGLNNTSFVASFGVQKNGDSWNVKSGGPLLKNGNMDCFLFRIHDDASVYTGILDLTMRHRINWKESWQNEGVHITTYKTTEPNSTLEHFLATDKDAKGLFFASNYQPISLESIKGKLNADDQRLLDKYLMQVDAGHVRAFVFGIDDNYLSTLEKLQ